MVALTEVGKELPMTVYRGGKSMHLSVKVAARSQFEKVKPVSAYGSGYE
jgi:hypothetical protein